MRTDCLFAHKVRSQQGGGETVLLKFFEQFKGEHPYVQCGFADDMDYQNRSDLAPKCVEYGQIPAEYCQDVIHIYVLHIVVRLFAGAVRIEENPESYNSQNIHNELKSF